MNKTEKKLHMQKSETKVKVKVLTISVDSSDDLLDLSVADFVSQ